MKRVPSTHTKVGDRVRICFDQHYNSPVKPIVYEAQLSRLGWPVLAFDGETGEAYVGNPSEPLGFARRIRSWVRVRQSE